MRECLLRPEIPFRRQNRSVPEQQLDLFQVSTSFAGELGAGSPEIVRGQLSQLRLPGVANHQTPNSFLVLYAAPQHHAGLGHRPEEPAFADPCGRRPKIDAGLHAGGDGHGPNAVQVRNPGAAGVTVEKSSYMSSELPVAGFCVIEAASLSDAIELVSTTPCAVAHGVVEVWPLREA